MKNGVTSQNKMICFVRRRFGWCALPEDVRDWLQVCDQIANMCQTGVTTFEEDGMQIVSENFTYTVEFNLDNSAAILEQSKVVVMVSSDSPARGRGGLALVGCLGPPAGGDRRRCSPRASSRRAAAAKSRVRVRHAVADSLSASEPHHVMTRTPTDTL
jgi:hypothetical protein